MSQGFIHADFETRSLVDLKKTGAYVYAKHLTTEPLCMAYALDNNPIKLWKLGDPAPFDLMSDIKNGATFVSHNAAFELAIWNYVCSKKFGWPVLTPEQTICTMAMAYAMAIPATLEGACAALGLKHQKDMQGYRIMLQLCKPRDITPEGKIIWWDDPAKYERLYEYCPKDVEAERELFTRLLPLSQKEREVWLLDYKINSRGVACDVHAITKAIELVNLEKKRLDTDMRWATRGAVATCTATAQLTDWIISKGIELEGVAKADVIDLLALENIPDDVRAALLLRQEAAKSSTAKLESMLRSTCDDGRIRGIFQYHGAGTGRWAGRRIQPQNFPRPNISQEDIEEIFGLLRRVS